MSFAVPPPSTRLRAIGSLAGLPEPVKRALEPRGDFDPLPAPGPNDWLANHPEPGQTFEQFLHSQPNRPDAIRRKLYLQPLGEFAEDEAPPLGRLRQFAAGFFGMEIGVLPSVNLTQSAITVRQNPYTRNTQLLTTDILTLLRRRLPEDGYALLGITMEDLYPEPSWNFVFGQASLRHRVGVYSFARYDPRFYGGADIEDGRALLLRRSCKVLAHEMAHMFGIQHCIYFRCLMNGSNHLAESDARPLHLCPADLRKLYESVGFDVLERYHRLLKFSWEVGFEDEVRWLKGRIAFIARPELANPKPCEGD